MKTLYLMICLVVFAGCCSCAERDIKETEDDVIALRLTLEWKRMMEGEVDALKGEYVQLAHYVRNSVHLQSWLLTKKDQALPEHKAIYQEILDYLETK